MHQSAVIAALAAALSTVPLVSAHGYVSGVVAGGKYFAGTSPNWNSGEKTDTCGWYAENQDNGFVKPSEFSTPDIICHKNAEVGGAPFEAAAGDELEFQWNTWPDSHKGPVITYIASVSSEFKGIKKESLKWAKIAAEGLKDGSSPPGKWATDDMLANNFTAGMTLPSSLKPGNYVIRHEILALHSAGQEDGAQAYPQCLNMKLTGSGTADPSADGVVGTDLYTASDPGIKVDIYQSMDSYKIPGPAMWEGASEAKSAGKSAKGQRKAVSFAA